MYYVFNQTCIGYSHLKDKKPCQDFSASYQDNERIIITCCDGHGGAKYVRSQYGSKAASDAVLNIFKSIDRSFFYGLEEDKLVDKIKLLILCEYNRIIENYISEKPLRKSELVDLSEDDADSIRFNQAKAYGTTLSGAMIFQKRLIVVSIGDTEALGIRKGEIVKLFDNSNDPAGNITYSMCQEDAYNYLRVVVLPVNEFDGVLLCTDGMSSPYQSYVNFNNSFIRPTVRKVLNTRSLDGVETHVKQLASELGVGDDVSLSFIINKMTNVKFYR